jgi:hypothetical protein
MTTDEADPGEDNTFIRQMNQLLADEPPVVGQWFFKQQVPLDGRKFVRCHFEECTLEIETGAFSIQECKLTRCKYSFTTPALNVVKLLNYAHWHLGGLGTDVWDRMLQSVRPFMNADGTISW